MDNGFPGPDLSLLIVLVLIAIMTIVYGRYSENIDE